MDRELPKLIVANQSGRRLYLVICPKAADRHIEIEVHDETQADWANQVAVDNGASAYCYPEGMLEMLLRGLREGQTRLTFITYVSGPKLKFQVGQTAGGFTIITVEPLPALN